MHELLEAREGTILELTRWGCGTKTSTLERKRAWAHQNGENE